MKVKAAVCRKYGDPLSIEELELAAPKEYEVQVKMLACGFCQSTLHCWTGQLPVPLPMIFGHEACGIVEKVGPGVTKLKPGDRVIGCWMVPCGKCFQCMRGRPNLCERSIEFFRSGDMLDGTSRFTDKNGKEVKMDAFIGGFATHSIFPEIGAIRVPDHIQLPPEQLCLLGCAVLTGWGSVTNVAKATEGTSIGIWGCGGIGLNAIRAAALRHCRPIVAVDLEASKRDIALEFGATHFIDSSKKDPIPIIMELTHGTGLEYAVEAIGDPGAQVQAWWSLRMGASLIAIGVTPTDSVTNIPLAFGPLQGKSIRGALYGDAHPVEDIPIMMELMNNGLLKTSQLVTRTIGLEDLEETRRAMEARKIIGRWVVKFE